MTRRRAAIVASGWAACGMPGCDTSLYEFSSWHGRVVSEEQRERCCRAIDGHLCWVLANRQQIARGEYPEHNLQEFGELALLEQFILAAEVQPIQRQEMAVPGYSGEQP